MKRTFAMFSFILALAVAASGTLILYRAASHNQPDIHGYEPNTARCKGAETGIIADTPCVEAQGKDSGIRALSNGIIGGGFLKNCASKALQAVASTLSSDRNQ